MKFRHSLYQTYGCVGSTMSTGEKFKAPRMGRRPRRNVKQDGGAQEQQKPDEPSQAGHLIFQMHGQQRHKGQLVQTTDNHMEDILLETTQHSMSVITSRDNEVGEPHVSAQNISAVVDKLGNLTLPQEEQQHMQSRSKEPNGIYMAQPSQNNKNKRRKQKKKKKTKNKKRH